MTETASLEKEERKAVCHLHGRAVKAAERYLELRGYDCFAYEWPCESDLVDIVCRDADVLVFVQVRVYEDELPDDADVVMRRREFECMAVSYLAEYELVDVPIRLDIISILPAGDDRALLRHHINALGKE